MPRSRKFEPGEGQGGMLGIAGPKADLIEKDGFVYKKGSAEAASTTLADYYGTIAKAVKEIGRARSNSKGFPLLPDDHERVREFNYRLDTADPDETRHIISKTATMHLFKAQDILTKRHTIEYRDMARLATSDADLSIEFVNEYAMMPPHYRELEFAYFEDPSTEPKDLVAKRNQLYRRAQQYDRIQAERIEVA